MDLKLVAATKWTWPRSRISDERVVRQPALWGASTTGRPDILVVAAALDTNFPSRSRAIHALVDIGILHETTGKARNRVFVFQRYIKILNER